ncbi:MAG: gamma-glutamyl-gamma-aminobutyrate hydrolase family protein [Nitrospira sp.]|nr:gamma-glutamyl-gamma-aminobutyrate hydrolase family protein [Nitrospira sp.]MCY3955138.1 gamma-glutamyl-gamma-aminobutyrate hydrolase family protein [Nitrospira sp.]MCY4132642.1 gamma-glutamyl-gamma-aminobutyrate hydrolase family protein [Nitrospira sp.]
MNKPIIGVTPDFNAGNRKDMGGKEPTYFLRARYMKAIEDAGGIPVVLPLLSNRAGWRQVVAHVHGLLVTGSGSDLAPELYGERQRHKFARMSRERATMELGIAKAAYRADVPMLGICGGMQSINVALGGTLYQDIAAQLKTPIDHLPSHPATKTSHSVQIAPGSLLRRIAGKARMDVNSSHHQSIKKVASNLAQTAVAPDGVIEAIEAPDRAFILGVQWHPEFLYERDPVERRLFTALVRAARTFAEEKKAGRKV